MILGGKVEILEILEGFLLTFYDMCAIMEGEGAFLFPCSLT